MILLRSIYNLLRSDARADATRNSEVRRMNDNSLFDKLKALSRENVIPMHMPGHKRNLAAFPRLGELGAALDITEIDGFDNLHFPRGSIADICDRAARFFGAQRSFLSVNGGTGAVLAAIYAATKRGDRVLVARNCHRSVANAVSLLGLDADFVMPAVDSATGLCGGVSPEAVAKKCAATKYAAVIVTSPTYEGVVSDIAAIAGIVHSHGIPLIVDEAHGAHFVLSPAFPATALECGADLVVSSVHKTLPALTQTAFLHLSSDLVKPSRVRRAVSVFVTSSPSYILMSSVETMLDVLEKDGARLAADLVQSLGKFYDATGSLRYLSLPRDSITIDGVNYTKDISRIYIDCTKSSYTGCATKKFLRRKYGIEVENATVDGITLIASIGDDAQAFDRLTQAVIAADRTFFTLPRRKPVPLPPAGKAVPLPSNAEYRAEMYPFAVGKVSAENVCAYPPGIPLVLRGEIITDEIAKFLSSAERNGVQVLTDFGNPAGFVSIAEDDETE